MRFAVVVEWYPQTTETFVERHVRALKADVVTIYHDSEARLVSTEDGPRVYWLSSARPSPQNSTRRLASRLYQALLGFREPAWPAEMEALWDRYVSERRPDVVLAEFGPNGLCVLNGCKRHAIPLVVHFHGYDVSFLLRQKAYLNALPRLFSDAVAIVAVSSKMKSSLARLGCPSDKIQVIPCGAPIGDINRSKPTSDICEFLAVGRLIEVKGPLFTIRAFSYCHALVPATRLTVIGDGPLSGKARKLVKRLGLMDSVALAGEEPFSVVKGRMEQSDVFVQHSVTTRQSQVEGWGVAIAEAQAAGLPVVATTNGGIVDQVVDGTTGFLVPERDWRTMGKRMAQLARDASLRKVMGKAGRANIEEVGDSFKQGEKLRQLLIGAAGQSR